MFKQKIYMMKRWWKIVTGKSATAVRQKEGKYYSLNEIKGYYNDFSGKLTAGTILGDTGIPVTVIAGEKKVYFPIAICQYGLGCYDQYIGTDSEEWLGNFKLVLDYIFQIQEKNGSWNCFGPLESKSYKESSMCQGEGASLLIRGYVLTKDEKYLEAAKRAIDFMLIPVAEGGTALYEGEDIFLEEYPRNEKRMSVLNGWIFSLFGIYDLALIMPEYRKIFERSSDTLKEHIFEYNAGYWSFYDIDKRLASPAYHDLHIELLKVLNKMTDGGYESFIKKLQIQQENFLFRVLAIVKKIVQKIHEKSDTIVVQ